VHITGSKGAVKPGGVTITVRNLVSDKRASERAAKDGSFDLQAPGSASDAYEVHATSGRAQSKPVFVVNGEAVDGKGDAGTPSCEQWVQLAADQQDAVIAEADTSCVRDSDCFLARRIDLCVASCDAVWVSQTGLKQISAVVSAVHNGICAEYERSGCDPGPVGCSVPHGGAVCDRGHCVTPDSGPGVGMGDVGTSDAGGDAGDATCGGLWNAAMARLQQAIGDADKVCTNAGDCTYAPSSTDCFGGCDNAVVSIAGRTQVQSAVDEINADVCAGYVADGCPVGGPMCAQRPTPVCKQGRCEGMLSCEVRWNVAMATLSEAVLIADRACTEDADCDFAASAANCGGGCGYGAILSAKGRAQVDDAIAELNDGACKDFESDGCMAPMPACQTRPTPVCTQGQCGAAP
jgi:hypothetical protein